MMDTNSSPGCNALRPGAVQNSSAGIWRSEGASPRHLAAIRRTIQAGAQVRRLIHLRTLHLGPDQLLVAAKIELDSELGFVEVAAAINDLEARVRDVVPLALMIYLEPDVHISEPRPLAGVPTPHS